MGIRLITEVLDNAPAELTTSERLLLVVLAESARDETRRCWPGMEMLVQRTGLSGRGVQKTLERLTARGYEVRVAAGTDKNGRPTFAHSGHATVYQLPRFPRRANHSSTLKAVPEYVLPDGKGVPQGQKRAYHSAGKGEPQYAPPLNEPSREPSNPRDRRANADLNTIRAALVKVGCKRLDDDWCRQVVKHAEQNGTVRKDLTGFVVAYIEREPERFTPVADYAPRYRKEDH